MLKKNILATNAIYVCTEHKKKYIDKYLFNLDKIFKIISKTRNNGQLKKLINGPISKSDFRTINK